MQSESYEAHLLTDFILILDLAVHGLIELS